MLRGALRICSKDLSLLAGRGSGLTQALLLGLLLIFIFSLTRSPGEATGPQAAAAVFWVSSLFCQVLLFTALYALEEDNGQRQALLLAPLPVQGIWLGKGLAGLVLLLAAQLVFLPASVIFLDQATPAGGAPALAAWLLVILLADLGLAALGSMLGALAQGAAPGGHAARESLFSILAFPLLLPLLMAGIRTGAFFFGGTAAGEAEEFGGWIKIILACDAVFIGAGLLFFGFIYDARE